MNQKDKNKNSRNSINWRAYWIWLEKHRRSRNCYVCFRKTFRLDKDIKKALFNISAFTHYRLYFNGKEIGFGPNPTPPARYYYDSYNVTKQCRRGKNVIAVLAYNFGYRVPHDTTYAEDVGGGLIFQGEIRKKTGKALYIVSDDSWKSRKSDAWQANGPRYVELRHGNKEYVDGRKGPLGFVSPSHNDAKWAKADVLGKHPMEPFLCLVPREIKYFRQEEVSPVNAGSIGFNYAYGFGPERGWEIDDPLALVGSYPKGLHIKLLRGGENGDAHNMEEAGLLGTDCTIRTVRAGEHPSMLLDFGRLCNGRFRLEIDKAAAGAHIDIAYGETMNLTYIDRYITRKGKQAFSPYHRRVARYVLLTFKNAPAPLTLSKAVFDFISYPTESRGSFTCSEAMLNKIWRVSRNTLRLSMYDHFEDCPWREQKLYAGDMQIQALAACYTFPDYTYTRKCLRQIALVPRRDGWIAPAGPSHCPENRIVEFPARYIVSLKDYYYASGDVELIREVYPKLKTQLETYSAMKHSRGLVDIEASEGFGNWCFINWGLVDKRRIITAFNLLIIQALDAAGFLAEALGETEDAALYSKKACAYREHITKLLWNNKEGLFADCFANGKKSAHCSVETNAIALLAQCGTSKQQKSILDKALKNPRWMTSTAFFNTFVCDVLFKKNKGREAIDRMCSYWGEMINRGADTFWESFDYQTPNPSLPHKVWSLCHGWSSGPLYLMGAYILGVRPSAPGFSSARIQPLPLDIEWAEGVVPTPKGDIKVAWEKGELVIDLPNRIAPEIDLRYCRKDQKVFINGKRRS